MAIRKDELKVMTTVSEEVDQMVDSYLEKNNERRTAYFTKIAMEKVQLDRKTKNLEQALNEKEDVLSMAETAPIAWKSIIKPYFDDFSMDNGGCVALGRWLSDFKKYVLEENGDTYFLDKGRQEHLYNYLMLKAQKSKSMFFTQSRKNIDLWEELSERIRKFSKVMFFREMQSTVLKYK